MEPRRLDQMIALMAQHLSDAGIDTARLDARLLAGHALDLREMDMLLQFDRVVSEDEQRRVLALVERRLKREPVAHILGEREFWGLPFKVTADTLVPRPDSETLISAVLDHLSDDRSNAPLRIADIGTGSGCLLLSLLSELPHAFGLGIDISMAAIKVAQANASALRLADRCAFARGDYATAVAASVDILISNPPYLAEAEMADLDRDVADYDPKGALVSGPSGLEAYEALFVEMAARPEVPSLMALEFGHQQARAVAALAQSSGLVARGNYRSSVLQDFGGRDRVLLLERGQS